MTQVSYWKKPDPLELEIITGLDVTRTEDMIVVTPGAAFIRGILYVNTLPVVFESDNEQYVYFHVNFNAKTISLKLTDSMPDEYVLARI